jgi:hypothetical protein
MLIELGQHRFEIAWISSKSLWIEAPILGAANLIWQDLPHSHKPIDVIRHDNGERELFIGGAGRWRLHAYHTPARVLTSLA